jgi:hypothetical protein
VVRAWPGLGLPLEPTNGQKAKGKGKAKAKENGKRRRGHHAHTKKQENSIHQGGKGHTSPLPPPLRQSRARLAQGARRGFAQLRRRHPFFPTIFEAIFVVQIQRQYSCCWATKKHSEYKQDKIKQTDGSRKEKKKKTEEVTFQR